MGLSFSHEQLISSTEYVASKISKYSTMIGA